MKVTINITDTQPKYGNSVEKETRTVAECADMEFTPRLTASFLRALADEIDPGKDCAPVEYGASIQQPNPPTQYTINVASPGTDGMALR